MNPSQESQATFEDTGRSDAVANFYALQAACEAAKPPNAPVNACKSTLPGAPHAAVLSLSRSTGMMFGENGRIIKVHPGIFFCNCRLYEQREPFERNIFIINFLSML